MKIEIDTDELRSKNPYDQYNAKAHHIVFNEVLDMIEEMHQEGQSDSIMAMNACLEYVERKHKHMRG